MRKPALGALVIGLVPLTAICFTVPLWDRIHPMVFGLPFNCFWLVLWILLTPLVMWAAYRVETRRDAPADPGGKRNRE